MRLCDLQPQPYGKEQPACVNRRVANWRLGPLIQLSPERLPTLIEQARTSYFLILVSRFGLADLCAESFGKQNPAGGLLRLTTSLARLRVAIPRFRLPLDSAFELSKIKVPSPTFQTGGNSLH